MKHFAANQIERVVYIFLDMVELIKGDKDAMILDTLTHLNTSNPHNDVTLLSIDAPNHQISFLIKTLSHMVVKIKIPPLVWRHQGA
ncbi:hypothetical protein DNK63_09530 [Providencia rettgeri]|nr:hypothetical protein DNK63_09530 [Providencia rettgeri]